MGAPNPWHHSLPPLDSKNQLLEGEHPLDMIRDFLLEWPGEPTVLLSKVSQRHQRLVQIVGGYPEIGITSYPLDWPLHPKSLKAMRLSRYLDSLPSPVEGMSLRSALLNKDASIRNLDLHEGHARKSYRRFLALLFIGIREDFGVKQFGFTEKELKLLGSLHSSASDRIGPCWPWNEIEYYNGNNKKVEITWENNSDLFDTSQGEIWGIKFQKIQKWIIHWSASRTDKDWTATLIRGASALIEGVLSSLRHAIIHNFGVGSIVVDGGGRLEFIAKYNPEGIINAALYSAFANPYFGKSDGLSYKAKFANEVEQVISRWGDIREKVPFYKRLEKQLPPHVVYQPGSDLSHHSSDEVEFGQSKNCPLCNHEIPIPSGVSWQSLFGRPENNVCDFHSLLYYTGKAQRYLDSAIRDRGKSLKFTSKETFVSSIARLDLNSLGLLFTSEYDDSAEFSLDVKRRRSFRFNSHWWQIIHEVVDSSNYQVDRIAAWMAAGDDIILAEYRPIDQKESSEESDLGILLSNLAFKLSDLSDEEFQHHRLTFSGGLSIRGDDTIQNCLVQAEEFEHWSKRFWRGYMLSKGNEEYLIGKSGNTKEYFDFEKLRKSNDVSFKLSRDCLWISDSMSF